MKPLNRVRMAALLSQMMSEPHRMVNDKCALIKESDLKKLTAANNVQEVQKADEMMTEARAIVKAAEMLKGDDGKQLVGSTKALELIAKNDIRIVNYLLGVQKRSQDTPSRKARGLFDIAYCRIEARNMPKHIQTNT